MKNFFKIALIIMVVLWVGIGKGIAQTKPQEITPMTQAEFQMRMLEAINDLKADVTVLKTDVAALKTDVVALKTDVAVLKTDVAVLKTEMLALKETQKSLERTVWALFGFLGLVMVTILGFVFSIARSVRPPRLKELFKKVNELAKRQEALEQKLASGSE